MCVCSGIMSWLNFDFKIISLKAAITKDFTNPVPPQCRGGSVGTLPNQHAEVEPPQPRTYPAQNLYISKTGGKTLVISPEG